MLSRRVFVLTPLLATPMSALGVTPIGERKGPWDTITAGGMSRPVWFVPHSPEKAERPPIILMHEITGLKDLTWQLADRLAEEGYPVYLPDLFDRTGVGQPDGEVRGFVGGCIALEWRLLCGRKESPIATFLRELAQRVHRDHSRPVAVIGMCLTGNLALAAVLEDGVEAINILQPAYHAGRFLADHQLEAVRARIEAGQCAALAFRYERDWKINRATRKLQAEMEGAVPLITLPGCGHSTMTADFHQGAYEQMLAFLEKNLRS